MKRSLLYTLLFLSSFHAFTQTKIKQPKFRIDAGPVVSCMGYYNQLRFLGEQKDYINLLSRVQLSARISRKNEIYFAVEHKKKDLLMTNLDIPFTQSYTPNTASTTYRFNLISFGIKHFFKGNVSPIGNYFGIGATISKISSDPFTYTYTNNGETGLHGGFFATDLTVPCLTISQGKRTMINKNWYFNRELNYSFCLPMVSIHDSSYTNFAILNSLTLSNFQYTFSIGTLF